MSGFRYNGYSTANILGSSPLVLVSTSGAVGSTTGMTRQLMGGSPTISRPIVNEYGTITDHLEFTYALMKADYTEFTEQEQITVERWLTSPKFSTPLIVYDCDIVDRYKYYGKFTATEWMIGVEGYVAVTFTFSVNGSYAYETHKGYIDSPSNYQMNEDRDNTWKYNFNCISDELEEWVYPTITFYGGPQEPPSIGDDNIEEDVEGNSGNTNVTENGNFDIPMLDDEELSGNESGQSGSDTTSGSDGNNDGSGNSGNSGDNDPFDYTEYITDEDDPTSGDGGNTGPGSGNNNDDTGEIIDDDDTNTISDGDGDGNNNGNNGGSNDDDPSQTEYITGEPDDPVNPVYPQTDPDDTIIDDVNDSDIEMSSFLKLKNITDNNQEMTLNISKSNVDRIKIDCKNCIVTANNGIMDINFEDFGWDDVGNIYWLRLKPGKNELEFVGSCHIIIEYDSPVKISGGWLV